METLAKKGLNVVKTEKGLIFFVIITSFVYHFEEVSIVTVSGS